MAIASEDLPAVGGLSGRPDEPIICQPPMCGPLGRLIDPSSGMRYFSKM